MNLRMVLFPRQVFSPLAARGAFLGFAVVRMLDVVTTALIVSVFGPGVESNSLAMWGMIKFGAWGGIVFAEFFFLFPWWLLVGGFWKLHRDLGATMAVMTAIVSAVAVVNNTIVGLGILGFFTYRLLPFPSDYVNWVAERTYLEMATQIIPSHAHWYFAIAAAALGTTILASHHAPSERKSSCAIALAALAHLALWSILWKLI